MTASADRAALDAAILAAHAADDRVALIGLYAQAAELMEDDGATDAAGFLRVQAYVFALEVGDPRAAPLRARLAADGREA